MVDQENKQKLRAFFNTLEDKPLEPDDQYYVPYLERADADPIQEIFTKIEWSESKSLHLLTGMRGCGKSTELRRLRKELTEAGCEVFLCDMRDYMNLTTPVEISDFLVSLMVALGEAVEKRFGKNPSNKSYLERVTSWLQTTEISVDGAKMGLGDIKASLKEDPDFKQHLQQRLKGHVARLVKDAHNFASEVVEFVRKETNDADKKVILLVDSVEQLRGVGADGASDVYASAENLFSAHAESLHIPMLHVVYTIPPYLTPLVPAIGRQLGGGLVRSLPSIHIRNRAGDVDEENGVNIMAEILEKRCPQWEAVFSRAQVERMALSTGGDLRDFFRMARECIVHLSTSRTTTLPADDDVIEYTETQLRREMLPIAENDKEWLRRISASKKAELQDRSQLSQLARFFDTNVVLNYRNGEDWYDVHPLLVCEIDADEQ